MLKDAKGFRLQHWQLYPLLGLKVGHHLPDEGLPAQVIQGVTVYVRAKEGTRRPHRVIAVCSCGKHVPFGRLGQHVKGIQHIIQTKGGV